MEFCVKPNEYYFFLLRLEILFQKSVDLFVKTCSRTSFEIILECYISWSFSGGNDIFYLCTFSEVYAGMFVKSQISSLQKSLNCSLLLIKSSQKTLGVNFVIFGFSISLNLESNIQEQYLFLNLLLIFIPVGGLFLPSLFLAVFP